MDLATQYQISVTLQLTCVSTVYRFQLNPIWNDQNNRKCNLTSDPAAHVSIPSMHDECTEDKAWSSRFRSFIWWNDLETKKGSWQDIHLMQIFDLQKAQDFNIEEDIYIKKKKRIVLSQYRMWATYYAESQPNARVTKNNIEVKMKENQNGFMKWFKLYQVFQQSIFFTC